MYNNNAITAEVRVTRGPERSDRADVVKVGGAIFQGKKEDGKDPMWVQLNAWKYLGKCLETVAKNDVLIVTGSLSQEFWEKDGVQKSKLVITCDTIAKKVWANQGQRAAPQPPPQTPANPQGGYGNQGSGYNPGPTQGQSQGQPQGGGYNGGDPGFTNPPPDGSDIPF